MTRHVTAFVCLLCLGIAAPAFSQGTSLTGRVRDP